MDEIGAAQLHRTTTKTNEKVTTNMKLTTTTIVSLDGVMQGIGGPDEDKGGGLERGGWATPFFSDESTKFYVGLTAHTSRCFAPFT